MKDLTPGIIGKIIKVRVPPYREHSDEKIGSAWLKKYGANAINPSFLPKKECI